MVKRFSIGSKKPTAKQIDINIKHKHIWFGAVVFLIAILFHMFVYSPYIVKEYKMVCSDGQEVVIIDNMDMVCQFEIPYNMEAEDIYNYIDAQMK